MASFLLFRRLVFLVVPLVRGGGGGAWTGTYQISTRTSIGKSRVNSEHAKSIVTSRVRNRRGTVPGSEHAR